MRLPTGRVAAFVTTRQGQWCHAQDRRSGPPRTRSVPDHCGDPRPGLGARSGEEDPPRRQLDHQPHGQRHGAAHRFRRLRSRRSAAPSPTATLHVGRRRLRHLHVPRPGPRRHRARLRRRHRPRQAAGHGEHRPLRHQPGDGHGRQRREVRRGRRGPARGPGQQVPLRGRAEDLPVLGRSRSAARSTRPSRAPRTSTACRPTSSVLGGRRAGRDQRGRLGHLLRRQDDVDRPGDRVRSSTRPRSRCASSTTAPRCSTSNSLHRRDRRGQRQGRQGQQLPAEPGRGLPLRARHPRASSAWSRGGAFLARLGRATLATPPRWRWGNSDADRPHRAQQGESACASSSPAAPDSSGRTCARRCSDGATRWSASTTS